MQSSPAVLDAGLDVGTAARRLAQSGLEGMPVVAPDGRYVGMLTLRQIFGAILPHAIKLGDLVGDLSYMHESLRSMREDLAAIVKDPVSGHLDVQAPVVGPDTEVTKILQLNWAGHDVLPVVDPATHRLVGVVTSSDILTKLLDGVHAR